MFTPRIPKAAQARRPQRLQLAPHVDTTPAFADVYRCADENVDDWRFSGTEYCYISTIQLYTFTHYTIYTGPTQHPHRHRAQNLSAAPGPRHLARRLAPRLYVANPGEGAVDRRDRARNEGWGAFGVARLECDDGSREGVDARVRTTRVPSAVTLRCRTRRKIREANT